MQYARSLVLLFAVTLVSGSIPLYSYDEHGYSEQLAIEYAKLAGATYCSKQALQNWTCGAKCIDGITSVKQCQGLTTQAFVARWTGGQERDVSSTGRCIAAFEGTNGLSSAEMDLKAFKDHKYCSGCAVHHGFLTEWESLKQCITESLKEIGCDESQALHATGHSLGGGVVSLGMFDLKYVHGWNVVEVYTFGQPRIGNSALASAFKETFTKGQFFRVTHGWDPFIDMPLGPFYVHVEPEIFYSGDVSQGYVFCDNAFDKRCSAQHFPDFQGYLLSSRLAYHHNYMGVDTTQAGCYEKQECGKDIKGSWCAYGIPCNQDARGKEVYCHHLNSFTGYGRCHCNLGYCPSDTGKCMPYAPQPAPAPPPSPYAPPPSPYAPSPQPAPAPSCNRQTGGTCNILGCSSFRGPTNCVGGFASGYWCVCQEGHCAYNGKCMKGGFQDTMGDVKEVDMIVMGAMSALPDVGLVIAVMGSGVLGTLGTLAIMTLRRGAVQAPAALLG